MRCLKACAAHAAILTASILGTVVSGVTAGFVETDLVVQDKNNPNLVNPWGLTWGVGQNGPTPFWVADNGAGVSTLYDNKGTPRSLVVSIPKPTVPVSPLNNMGFPTGVVFNIASASGAFTITGLTKNGTGPFSAAASFLFATEDGTILGWNPNVFVSGDTFPAAGNSTHAIIAVPKNNALPSETVYKGLAIATDSLGTTRLYATNFHKGTVEVFDTNFAPATPAGAFTDPKLPKGYAPFNIVPIGSGASARLVVTYAVQDANQHDDVAGMSHGIVNTFDLSGGSLNRLIQHGQLNSPWGVALAPASFGTLANKLLIGNFGNGQINAYDPKTGEFFDKMRNPHGQAIVIDGLWSLLFGNNLSPNTNPSYGPNTVFFTAGPNGEQGGVFGAISPSQ
jgi:uncharacterized protein (TIGR03118 family)